MFYSKKQQQSWHRRIFLRKILLGFASPGQVVVFYIHNQLRMIPVYKPHTYLSSAKRNNHQSRKPSVFIYKQPIILAYSIHWTLTPINLTLHPKLRRFWVLVRLISVKRNNFVNKGQCF